MLNLQFSRTAKNVALATSTLGAASLLAYGAYRLYSNYSSNKDIKEDLGEDNKVNVEDITKTNKYKGDKPNDDHPLQNETKPADLNNRAHDAIKNFVDANNTDDKVPTLTTDGDENSLDTSSEPSPILGEPKKLYPAVPGVNNMASDSFVGENGTPFTSPNTTPPISPTEQEAKAKITRSGWLPWPFS